MWGITPLNFVCLHSNNGREVSQYRVFDDDSRPPGEESWKIRHNEEECKNSFALVGSPILDQLEVEAWKGILRLVLEAQKLLLEANRRLILLIQEGYKELDNWFLAHTFLAELDYKFGVHIEDTKKY